MRYKYFLIFLLIAVMSLSSCKRTVYDWSNPDGWYEPAEYYDTSNIDVFYLVSTDVLSATDAGGNVSWRTLLTTTDRNSITAEMSWVESNMFYEDFNLISPYYHQFTFEALCKLDITQMQKVYKSVSREVCDAFDYYMENVNCGRKYIIAGFSQGAMLALDVLKHMTDEQYGRMVACYCLGYRLTEEDLEHPHIKAAQGADDLGVVISFNSTQTREAIWPLVSEGAAACINPVNWRTDSTPGTLIFNGTTNIVRLDPDNNVLLVDTEDPEYFYNYYKSSGFFADAGVSRDNLHHWDLLFYPRFIHGNALLRSRNAQVQ